MPIVHAGIKLEKQDYLYSKIFCSSEELSLVTVFMKDGSGITESFKSKNQAFLRFKNLVEFNKKEINEKN